MLLPESPLSCPEWHADRCWFWHNPASCFAADWGSHRIESIATQMTPLYVARTPTSVANVSHSRPLCGREADPDHWRSATQGCPTPEKLHSNVYPAALRQFPLRSYTPSAHDPDCCLQNDINGGSMRAACVNMTCKYGDKRRVKFRGSPSMMRSRTPWES